MQAAKGHEDETFRSLVLARPAPIKLVSVDVSSSGSDVPLFQLANSDDEINIPVANL